MRQVVPGPELWLLELRGWTAKRLGMRATLARRLEGAACGSFLLQSMETPVLSAAVVRLELAVVRAYSFVE